MQADLSNIDTLLERFRVGADDALFDLLKGEAIFGWTEIARAIESGHRCLEIGAGPGLLASLAARKAYSVDALEPSTDAFASFAPVLNAVETNAPGNMRFIRSTIEDYEPGQTYDLIWSVNVFEHLDDWRINFAKVRRLLNHGGRAIILVPNYDIPYEPHFSVPIIGSKRFSRRLFSKHIEQFEKDQNCAGLWDSINMIGARAVLNYARRADLDVAMDRRMMRRMFDRFFNDPELSRRHGLVRAALGVVRRTGLDRAICALPPRFHPYSAYHLRAGSAGGSTEDQ